MGKMKELWMDEMERLEAIYRAERTSGNLETPQEEGWDETEMEVAQSQEDEMATWEIIDGNVSWQHCGRPAYWDGEDVYCSKCQERLPD